MFLEDGEWTSADEYFEKVLDQEPENAQAYLGKLLAENKLRQKGELESLSEPFDSNKNYMKVERFGDKQLISDYKL